MALKGLDIFKLTPKTNCKECGNPTCMAFAMKVAQGSIEVTKCPHLSEEVLAKLAESTAPPMKTLTLKSGDTEYKLGGETVLFRHEKTFVSKTLYAFTLSDTMDDAEVKAVMDESLKVDYERIGERMYAELIFVKYTGNADRFVELARKAAEAGRGVILSCSDPATASKAVAEIADAKPVLDGANASNYEEMSKIATENGLLLGVTGENLDELYDTVEKLEALGNKNLVLNVGCNSIKTAFEAAVQIRRAAILNKDRVFGYPSLVDVAAMAPGDEAMQTALASLFTVKYGSIIVLEKMTYAESLALHGLRQNIFTDPQKPMKVEPGIYPLNKADENAPCCITVDFALTYFVVSGELERSGVPVNLLISDAGGYSVLTAWAAGKLSASSIAKFITDYDIENKIKNRNLILPGKVAVLKGELQEKLPGWNVVVGPNEAVALVKFMREFANK
ncbi:MAG: acetyl-CoA decarbonylase/synthase complex subunit gamma [Clostridiales bacterium]|jgi:acetyl-CoA decarbonylase/synthase complex subunit gamma|nr:acetyl-CoA decarbonylase/synthase complex subunit gamma [Clostridiales bacterium]